jgi:sirohydrochlorin cobaltochelatase
MQSMQNRNVTAELAALDEKVNALLPPRYQHCYTTVSPNSMGSAGLTYGPDGKVAWDEIWTTFCDLALAGGPPHRGTLLEPVSEAQAASEPWRYKNVVAEIDRAVGLTTGFRVVNGYVPGWVGVQCWSLEEAAWLQLAVTAENVSARRRQSVLQLPAGPTFRVEKEIKNVVVALAKASHYWDGHLTAAQQSLAADGVLEPATPAEAAANPTEYEAAVGEVENGLREAELKTSPRRYVGWVGVETGGEEETVWLLRAVLVEQILARREGTVLYIPVGATPNSEQAAHAVQALRRAWELRKASSPRSPAWRPAGRSERTTAPLDRPAVEHSRFPFNSARHASVISPAARRTVDADPDSLCLAFPAANLIG